MHWSEDGFDHRLLLRLAWANECFGALFIPSLSPCMRPPGPDQGPLTGTQDCTHPRTAPPRCLSARLPGVSGPPPAYCHPTTFVAIPQPGPVAPPAARRQPSPPLPHNRQPHLRHHHRPIRLLAGDLAPGMPGPGP